MWPKLFFCTFLMLAPALVVAQEETGKGPALPVAATAASDATAAPAVPSNTPAEPEVKSISGMSILGNEEAPMSLFIVPWKSSELGAETNLTRTLNERHVPVDREVFSREIAFYEVSAGSNSAAPAALSP